MKWEEARNAYPSLWLLIEALEAHTDGEDRILDKINVIDHFNEKSSKNALIKYMELHKRFPDKEYYVVHSDREKLNIKDQKWAGLGVRSGNEV